LTGAALLQSPYLNKGTAFSNEERATFKVASLLPPKINTLDSQVKRAYDQFKTRRTALGRNTFMTSLKGQNEVLFYRVIQHHLKGMFPIIYTPTAKVAVYSHVCIDGPVPACPHAGFYDMETF
jgi:malate dehydrogenase (oxaloacetate-decarboxylating)